MMNRINLRGRGFLEGSRLLRTPMGAQRRSYAKDEKEKDEELEVEEQFKARKGGVLHDKQQSLQEESYFHKEEVEKLKGLKKKLSDKEDKKNEENKK